MRLLLLVLVLTSNLSAFAGQDHESTTAWLSEPENCLQKMKFPCGLIAVKKLDFEWAGVNYVLSPESSLLLKDKKNIQFLKGSFFVQGKIRNAQIGPVEITGKSEIILKFEKGKAFLRVLRGEPLAVTYEKVQFERLPPGFENWYYGVAVGNKLNSGVMKPYETQSIFPQVAELMIGSRSEKVEALVEMRKTWSQSRELASAYYGAEVQGELVEEINERQRQAEAREKQNIANSKMRKLFRQKNEFE